MWAQIKKKNCHSQSAPETETEEREIFFVQGSDID